MSLVDADTGTIVPLDAAAAERRAERITLRLDAVADNYRAVLPMIREAVEKRDDLALGYPSPGAYVSDRFGQALAGLGIEVRRAVVDELTEAGLSTRAIAPVVGTTHKTIVQDRQAIAGGTSVPPGPESAHVSESPTPEPEVEPRFKGAAPSRPRSTPKPITGIDGKTYTPPAPKPQPAPVTPEEQRARDIEAADKRSARYLAELTDDWPYFRSWMAGNRRAEVSAHMVPPTIAALEAIEKEIGR